VDRAGLIEYYILSEQDLSLIRRRRGDHNRLGISVQLALLRSPGVVLQADETPPEELINFLALQLNISSSVWEEYAQRDETRREHLLELQTTTEFVHSLWVSTAHLPDGCCPLLCKPTEASRWFVQLSRSCAGGQ
jgi:hypothetical protein